ncbi:MAG: hypothetical protein ACRERD_28045 [Candidatus Binatia bacterium]
MLSRCSVQGVYNPMVDVPTHWQVLPNMVYVARCAGTAVQDDDVATVYREFGECWKREYGYIQKVAFLRGGDEMPVFCFLPRTAQEREGEDEDPWMVTTPSAVFITCGEQDAS